MRNLRREPDPPLASVMTTKNHLARIEQLSRDLKEVWEIINLLSALEPGLKKYKGEEDGWGNRSWDLKGMRDALEFDKLQKAHKKYATNPVVSETKNKKE